MYGLFEGKQYCVYLLTRKNHLCKRYLRVNIKQRPINENKSVSYKNIILPRTKIQ